MAQLMDIQMAQKSLEECVIKKMDQLQAQLQSGGSAKDTVAKVAEEFRSFRELTFSMLSLLQKQISECARVIDVMETRHRKKSLIFSGIKEKEKEDCTSIILGVLQNTMAIKDLSANSIKLCHRLGSIGQQHQRPILVKFYNSDIKAAVWRSKSRLKGSSISIKEFLTKARQSVFVKARLHFGMRSCWTQDGTIVIKPPDNSRHKVMSMDQLDPLLAKYPKTPTSSTATTAANK